ncbi:MAG: phosphatidate cytidylyltransferase [Actinomycetota bacterium]|nr:MAG: phosphatidate cytidylyltransferase [Actinomycetota bacterium]
MAEYGGPIDSEDDKPETSGGHRFEPQSIENLGNEGFQLPPWTDPPTGEIPVVLSNLDADDTSLKSRLSSLRLSSIFTAANGLNLSEKDESNSAGFSERNLSSGSPRSSRYFQENDPDQRPSKKISGPAALRISSRNNSSGGRVSKPAPKKNSHDEVFSPPDEIILPDKRFTLSLPKLQGVSRRKSGLSGNEAPSANIVDSQEDMAAASVDAGIRDAGRYVPSSFESRKERILRAKNESGAPRRRSPVYIRIATGIGLGVVVLLAFHFGAPAVLAVVAIAILLAMIEFYDTLRRAGFRPAALLGLAGTLSLLITTYEKGANGIALVFASMVVTSMLWYLVGVIRGQPTLNISVTFLGFIWIGGLGSFGAAIIRPQEFPHGHGVAYLLGALIATVANDTAAYFFGSWIGKHKLAKEISPTKSWEGLIAGAVASLLVSAVIVSQISPWTVSKAVILGIVVAVAAPLGDLSESMIKRDLKIKDMGKLLPGHGGMLDRIDGLLFVLPTVYYLLKILHLS